MKRMYFTLSLITIILSGSVMQGMDRMNGRKKGNEMRQRLQNLNSLLGNQTQYYDLYKQRECPRSATFQKYALSLEHDKLQLGQIADEDLSALAQWVSWADENFPDVSSHKEVSQPPTPCPSTKIPCSKTMYDLSNMCKVAPWVVIVAMCFFYKTMY